MLMLDCLDGLFCKKWWRRTDQESACECPGHAGMRTLLGCGMSQVSHVGAVGASCASQLMAILAI